MVLSECRVKTNLDLMLYCKDFYFYFSTSPAEACITLIIKERGRYQSNVHFHKCSQSFCSQSSSARALKEELSFIFDRLFCDLCSLPPQKCDGAESAEKIHRGLIHKKYPVQTGTSNLKMLFIYRFLSLSPWWKVARTAKVFNRIFKKHCHLSSLKCRISYWENGRWFHEL